MSVQTEYLAIYGVKAPYKTFVGLGCGINDYFTKPDPNGGVGEPIFVDDGMGGEYDTFGILLGRAGWAKDSPYDLEFRLTLDEMQKAHDKFMAFVAERNIDINGHIPKLHIFNHYS